MAMANEEKLPWERVLEEMGLNDPVIQEVIEEEAQRDYMEFIAKRYPHLAGRIEPMSKEDPETYWKNLMAEREERMERIKRWTMESREESEPPKRRRKSEKHGGSAKQMGSSGRRPEGEADDRRAQGGEAEEEAADEAWWKSMF
jgi:hypothetical protein